MIFKDCGRQTFEYDFSTRFPNCSIKPKYVCIECSDWIFIYYQYQLIFKS